MKSLFPLLKLSAFVFLTVLTIAAAPTLVYAATVVDGNAYGNPITNECYIISGVGYKCLYIEEGYYVLEFTQHTFTSVPVCHGNAIDQVKMDVCQTYPVLGEPSYVYVECTENPSGTTLTSIDDEFWFSCQFP